MVYERRIRAYSDEEQAALGAQRDLPAEEQQCPACGELGIRRYLTMFEGRTVPTIAHQTWCPACHAFCGSYGPASGRVVETDPAKDDPDAPTGDGGKAALEKYFSYLDQLWDQGLLPQRITKH